MTTPTQSQIETILTAIFQPTYLQIQDDSARHRGHVGAKQGHGGHYIVEIHSALFAGKNLVEQHRLVNEALKDLFKDKIHALKLKTGAV